MSYGPVPLYLDPRGTASFVFQTPDYVHKALGGPERVEAETASKAETAYEKRMRAYVEHVRTAFAEPVIILSVTGHMPEFDDEGFRGYEKIGDDAWGQPSTADQVDSQVELTVSYRLAFRIHGALHYRELDRSKDWDVESEKQYKPGSRFVHEPRGTVLPYSASLHETIDALIGTISNAGRKLNALLAEKDVATALLKAGGNLLLAPPKDGR